MHDEKKGKSLTQDSKLKIRTQFFKSRIFSPPKRDFVKVIDLLIEKSLMCQVEEMRLKKLKLLQSLALYLTVL